MSFRENCETERELLKALLDIGWRLGAGFNRDGRVIERRALTRWCDDVIQATVCHEPMIQRSLLEQYKKGIPS